VRIGSYRVWGVAVAVGVLLSGLAAAQDGGGSLSGLATGTPPAGGSFGDSVKDGWNKFTQAITPKSHVNPAPDATALATPAKPGPELYVAIGRVDEQQGKFDQAEEQYQQALALDAKNLGALMAMARLRDRQNRFDEALQCYHRALQAHPKEAGVLNDLGLCLARRQMYRESITALHKAIQLQPQKPLYHNNLASVLVETGDMEGAYAELRAAHEEPEAYYDLGYLMYYKGNRQAAAALFTKALEKKPSLTEARVFLEKLGPLRPTAPPRYGQPMNQPSPPSPAAPPRSAKQAAQPYYPQPVNQAPPPNAVTLQRYPEPAVQPCYPQPVSQVPPPNAITPQRYPEPAAQPYYPEPVSQVPPPNAATPQRYPEPAAQPDHPDPNAQPQYGEPAVRPQSPLPSGPAGPTGLPSNDVPNMAGAPFQGGWSAMVPGGPPNGSPASRPPGDSPGPQPFRPMAPLDPSHGNLPSGPEIPGATSLPRLPPILPQVDGPPPGSRDVPYMASRTNPQPGLIPQPSPPAASGPFFGDRLPGNVVPLPPVRENDLP
jgi:Flp pilus assembly protein TadD